MISLNYAKKIGNKYVLNLYADKQSDLENFDISKNFMFYGTPAVGSVITVVGGDKVANYYLNDQGTFVKIETGGDEPVPGEFISFEVEKSYSGIDFGNVILGETSATMDEFLAGLDYEDSQCLLLSGDLSDGTDYFFGAVYMEGVHALLVGGGEDAVFLYSDKDDKDFGDKGWKNLTDGKFMFPSSCTIREGGINDTTPPTWNGVLFGAIEGAAALTPIEAGQTLAGLIIDPTVLTLDQMDSFVNSFDTDTYLVSTVTQDSIGAINVSRNQGMMIVISDEDHIEENNVLIVGYVKEDGVWEGVQVTHGWNEIRIEEDGETLVATPLTERKQYTFGGTGGAYINAVSESFDVLNGVAIGGIEGETPTVTLTPFSDGQRINGFVIDPNAVPEGYSTMADYIATFNESTTLLGLNSAGGVYVDLSKGLPVIQVLPEDDTYVAAYISSEEVAQSIDENLHAGWILMDSTGDDPVYSQITEVTDLTPEGFSHLIDTKDDTISNSTGWNGVFVGAHLDPGP